MTRSRFIDVDIEAIGCGIWVDVGDAEGWRTALAQLDNDPDLRQEMGRRGREFAERHHNAALFGRGVVDAVTRVARAR
jgi:glycosyltransferase involved in cell wall biosynthesis